MNQEFGNIGEVIANLTATIQQQAALLQSMQQKLEGMSILQQTLIPKSLGKHLEDAKTLTGRKIDKSYTPGSTIDVQDNLAWRELKTKVSNGKEYKEFRFKGGIRFCITEHDPKSKKVRTVTGEDGKKRNKYLVANLPVEQLDHIYFLMSTGQFDARYGWTEYGFQNYGKRMDKEQEKLYSIVLTIKNERVTREKWSKQAGKKVPVEEEVKVIMITERPGVPNPETGAVNPVKGAKATMHVRKEMSFEEFEMFMISIHKYVEAERIRSSILGLPFATLIPGGKVEADDVYDAESTSDLYRAKEAQEAEMEHVENRTQQQTQTAANPVASAGTQAPFASETKNDEDEEIQYIPNLAGKRFRDLNDEYLQMLINFLAPKAEAKEHKYWNSLYDCAMRVQNSRQQFKKEA